MVTLSTINRLVSTAADFDLAGLGIIAYYLRLYAVEQILAEQERSKELTEVATELLNEVEQYKTTIQNDGDDQNNAVNLLVQDQGKAKIYVSNFAMSLYNGKLQQIQSGPWDINLRRGLRCCIDLFSCIIHLWDDDDGSYKKRVKYCKLYLSKIVKGEIGEGKSTTSVSSSETKNKSELKIDTSVSEPLQDGSFTLQPHSSSAGVEEPVPSPTLPQSGSFLDSQANNLASDDEIDEMLERLKAKEEEEERDGQSNGEDDRDTRTDQKISHEGCTKDSFSDPQLPEFLDSDEEIPNEAANVEKKAATKLSTKEDLFLMMDKGSKIEKVQKMAKYAISALNYEDISTARDELSAALELLNSIK